MINLEIDQTISQEAVIYKYLTFESFVFFMETGKLPLINTTSWEDPWENELSKAYFVKYATGELEKPIYNFDSHIYGQCWTILPESDAMWRIYSPQKTGIKIAALVSSFKKIETPTRAELLKIIYYSDISDLFDKRKNNEKSIFSSASYKRKPFEHEQEVRLLTHPNLFKPSQPINSTVLYIDVDPAIFLVSVELDPRAPSWIEDLFSKYCSEKIPKVPFGKSKLYQPGQHTIISNFVPTKKLNQ